ncbi:MAG: peptide chain release factor N(5)-glutamine methyltransferase [Bacteroidetes bacterium]|nr:peptide chain release factor N(5)-glutamine methyltransferase [Bacteroidota bacterium]
MTVGEQQKIFREQLTTIYPDGEARSITAIVLENILGLNSNRLALERFQILTTDQQARFTAILQRLLKQEPVQYILEEGDFFGWKFKVNNSVLIPRPETEELVYWVCESFNNQNGKLSILDIGTGSGCISISLSKKMPHTHVEACDISVEALKVAEENNSRLGTSVDFFQLDILQDKLKENYYDVIISNPPYIAINEKETIEQNVIAFEPHLALFVSNEDDLVFYRRIGEAARLALKPGGLLFFEIHENRGADVKQLLENQGFDKVLIKKDFQGKDRMVKASK